MRFYLICSLLAVVVLVECGHTFLGTNVQRALVHHSIAKYSANRLTKRIEIFTYALPSSPYYIGRSIQGFLAYDLTNSSASANVTNGGIGFNYVTLRMKSERGKAIKYDINIYA